MVARCYSGAINGVDASAVEIEVSSSKGTSSFAIVGLPDTAVKEAKDRVSTALRNSGFRSKDEYSVTVNLAPADVRKEGPIYDLPIAVALLKATQRLRTEELSEYALVGELSLSGGVRRVRGIIPIVVEMRRIGRRAVLVPEENAEEASVVSGIDVIPVRTLVEAVKYLSGELEIEPHSTDLASLVAADEGHGDDFADVKGQESLRKAVEVAVAGGHNLLMIGSPGSGKTMIARRIPSILPPMSVEEALEVSKIHSVAGREKGGGMFVTSRPFRAPHHTVSSIGLLGGGTKPVPGEVSLAHRGVLFLDEFAEFPRPALEVLRQPLEDGHVSVSRAAAALDFPSRFMLVAAMNPCPCGYYNHPDIACTCQPGQVQKYLNRISGPLLDRIDIQIEVVPVPFKDISKMEKGETSAAIRKRVIAARNIQNERYKCCDGIHSNSNMTQDMLDKYCRLNPDCLRILKTSMERLNLSARAYNRILKVARTIADLDASENIETWHLSEAINYRSLDRETWGIK